MYNWKKTEKLQKIDIKFITKKMLFYTSPSLLAFREGRCLWPT